MVYFEAHRKEQSLNWWHEAILQKLKASFEGTIGMDCLPRAPKKDAIRGRNLAILPAAEAAVHYYLSHQLNIQKKK